MDYGNISVLVFLASGAGDEVCVHQADFIAWEHTEVFADRLLHEVFALDVQFSSERYLTAAKLRILEVILYFQHLNLVFRIVVDDKFHRI